MKAFLYNNLSEIYKTFYFIIAVYPSICNILVDVRRKLRIISKKNARILKIKADKTIVAGLIDARLFQEKQQCKKTLIALLPFIGKECIKINSLNHVKPSQ